MQRAAWYLKSDVEPPQSRLILPSGDKILICKCDAPADIRVKSQQKQVEQRERNKAQRRKHITASASQPDFPDGDP